MHIARRSEGAVKATAALHSTLQRFKRQIVDMAPARTSGQNPNSMSPYSVWTTTRSTLITGSSASTMTDAMSAIARDTSSLAVAMFDERGVIIYISQNDWP